MRSVTSSTNSAVIGGTSSRDPFSSVMPGSVSLSTGDFRYPQALQCRVRSPAHRGEREQGAAGRADLDLGAHARADAAVVARRPPAVVQLLLGERLLPVGPQPLAVQPGVQVVPREHLGLAPL